MNQNNIKLANYKLSDIWLKFMWFMNLVEGLIIF